MQFPSHNNTTTCVLGTKNLGLRTGSQYKANQVFYFIFLALLLYNENVQQVLYLFCFFCVPYSSTYSLSLLKMDCE